MVLAGEGEVMTGWAGARGALDGESTSSPFFLNFCDDFRGGGLGGSGDSLFFLRLSLPFLSPSRTVEFDEEDVRDSLRTVRP